MLIFDNGNIEMIKLAEDSVINGIKWKAGK